VKIKPTANPAEERFETITSRALNFTVVLLLLGLLVVAGAAEKSVAGGVLAAGAAAMAGALLGLLFGIPKTATVESLPAAGQAAGQAPAVTQVPRPGNTGLEQVADWLTKLLLGAGLTQIGPIGQHLWRLSEYIGGAVFGDGDGAGRVLGLALVIFFGGAGFIGGWLATKLRLAEALLSADLTLQKLLEAARQAGRQEGIERAASEINSAGLAGSAGGTPPAALPPPPEAGLRVTSDEATREPGVKPPPTPRNEAARWEPPTRITRPNDPQKNRFGGPGAEEANGRRLVASVRPLGGGDSELFSLELAVESTDSARPLRDPVKFFLHDSFKPNDTLVVLPDAGGQAVLSLIVWGAFTVGAITDGGKTLLELDLEFLEGAPEKFRSR